MSSLYLHYLSSPRLRRVFNGMTAHGYGQLATIGTQLLSLPIFLLHWDTATYGIWLTLSTVPAYLSLADVGFLTATTNRMIALEAKHEHKESNRVFQSAIVFLLCVSALLMVLSLIAAGVLATIGGEFANYALPVVVLTATVVLALYTNLVNSIYTATNGFALGSYLWTTSRLVEWGGGIAGLMLHGSFLAVASGMLITKGVFLGWTIWFSGRRTRHLRWGVSDASWTEIRQTLRPAMLFAVFPLSTALSLQGFTVMITAILGPAATTIFTSYRTVSRIVLQATAALSNSMWPEFAHMYSTQDPGLRSAYHRASAISVAIGVTVSLAVFAASPWLISYWSHGHLAYSWQLMLAFTIYSVCASLWHVPRVMLLCINRHGGLARDFALSAILSLVAGALLAHTHGIQGAVLAMIVAEVAICLRCVWAVRGVWRSEAQ